MPDAELRPTEQAAHEQINIGWDLDTSAKQASLSLSFVSLCLSLSFTVVCAWK